MKNVKAFIGILLILLIVLVFFVPLGSGMFPYILVGVILLGLIWKVAKWF